MQQAACLQQTGSGDCNRTHMKELEDKGFRSVQVDRLALCSYSETSSLFFKLDVAVEESVVK